MVADRFEVSMKARRRFPRTSAGARRSCELWFHDPDGYRWELAVQNALMTDSARPSRRDAASFTTTRVKAGTTQAKTMNPIAT